MSDAINKPAHYNQGSIECIEAMKIVLTPEEFRGYLKGNVFKYLWREKDKNGNEDIRKGKSYYDRLIELIDEYERQESADLQSLKDHPFGKLKEPAWTPKIGDWVRINAPEPGDPMHTKTLEDLDGRILQVVGLSEFDKRYSEFKSDHGSFYVLIDLLEPAEQPKAHLNSDTIPEGYRKLGNSREEPRQLGDLRWSVSEKRYVEITVDEIGYANRDNWAACRKVEPVIKQSLNTEPPDGWRFLEVGEVIRKGDKQVKGDAVPLLWIGTPCCGEEFILRRNRFEVGEKVVYIPDQSVWTYVSEINDGPNHPKSAWVKRDGTSLRACVNNLAPYIEDAK